MKIAELSRRTGVSVATLKYYLREGLLQPGEPTAVNQADYGTDHVRRVRLVRVLVELGRLSISDVARVVAAVDDDSVNIHDAFGLAQDGLIPSRDRSADAVALHEVAMTEVDRFLTRHRLRVRPDAHVRVMLADALVGLTTFHFGGLPLTPGGVVDCEVFAGFVESAKQQAAFELDTVAGLPRDEQVVVSVVGTVAFEVGANAVRRAALEDASQRRNQRPTRRRQASSLHSSAAPG